MKVSKETLNIIYLLPRLTDEGKLIFVISVSHQVVEDARLETTSTTTEIPREVPDGDRKKIEAMSWLLGDPQMRAEGIEQVLRQSTAYPSSESSPLHFRAVVVTLLNGLHCHYCPCERLRITCSSSKIESVVYTLYILLILLTQRRKRSARPSFFVSCATVIVTDSHMLWLGDVNTFCPPLYFATSCH